MADPSVSVGVSCMKDMACKASSSLRLYVLPRDEIKWAQSDTADVGVFNWKFYGLEEMDCLPACPTDCLTAWLVPVVCAPPRINRTCPPFSEVDDQN